jgi:hypothetical protein
VRDEVRLVFRDQVSKIDRNPSGVLHASSHT